MTKLIPILSGRCLVVELPEKHEAAFKALRNGRELTINRKNKSANVDHITFDFGFAEQLFNHGLLDCTSGSLDTGDRHYLFGLGWRIIEMLSEVREEQAHWWVDYTGKTDPIAGGLHMWANYVTGGDVYSALESLESAIISEGYVFSNPYGDTKPSAIEDSVRWMTAQSRVLDRSRCLLLGREGL